MSFNNVPNSGEGSPDDTTDVDFSVEHDGTATLNFGIPVVEGKGESKSGKIVDELRDRVMDCVVDRIVSITHKVTTSAAAIMELALARLYEARKRGVKLDIDQIERITAVAVSDYYTDQNIQPRSK